MKPSNTPTPTSTPVLKPSANEDSSQPPVQSSINTLTYWVPSIQAGTILTITLRYLPIAHHPEPNSNLAAEDTETTNIDYIHNLSFIPLAMVASFFATTLLCNAIFGRRPSNDKHHDPLYHQIIQGAGHVMPSVLALGHSIFNFAGKSIFGDRAEGISHVASEALGVASAAQRINTIQDRQYDHAMDRSPLLDGNMRRIEYAAMRTENAIIYATEILTAYIVMMMNMGLTRIQINDNNRLYWLAGTYHTADIVEAGLIIPINEYAYYAEKIADTYIISAMLHKIGLSDSENPIKAVTPRSIDRLDKEIKNKLKKATTNAKEALEDFTDNLEDAAEEAGKKIEGAFHEVGHQLSNAGDTLVGVFRHSFSHHQTPPVVPAVNSAVTHNQEPETKISGEKADAKKDNTTNNEQLEPETNEEALTLLAISNMFFLEMEGYGMEEDQAYGSSNSSSSSSSSTYHPPVFRSLISQVLHPQPTMVDAETNTEGFGIFNTIEHRVNGATVFTANNLHFNFHRTADTPSNHGGIWGRLSEHARNLGHGIHSYKQSDGTVVIIFPNGMELEISGESFHHPDHSS